MDKQFLERHNLTESQRRFQRILEYVQEGGARDIEEAGEDQGPQGPGGGMPPQGGDPMGGGAPGGDPMGGGMPGGDPMGGGAPGGDPMGGGMPGDDPMGGGAPGGDPNAAQGGGAPQGVDGFNPQVADPSMGMQGGDSGTDGDEDVEEVDVDELVDTQDETKAKVAKLDGKIDALIQMINKFESDIDANNAHIDELKQEFEKRNPTAEERLNLRSMSSVPYMETPREYWSNKVAENPRYNIMNDNTIPVRDEQEEFELRRGDLDSNDDRGLSDSFEYPMNLKDILDW